MSKPQLEEIRNLQLVVENAKLSERKRCWELTMRLFQNTDNIHVLLYLAEAIKQGRMVPPMAE